MAEDKDNQYVAGKTENILSPREYIGQPHTGYAEVNQYTHPNEPSVGNEYPKSHGPRYRKPDPKEIGKIHEDCGPGMTREQNLRHAIHQAAIDHRLGGGSENRAPNELFLGFDDNGNPMYGQRLEKAIRTIDDEGNVYHYQEPEFFIKNRLDHFVRDVSQGIGDMGKGKPEEPFVDPNQSVTRSGYANGYENEPGKRHAVFSGSTTNINARDNPVVDKVIKSGTYGVYEDNRVAEIATYAKPPISADYTAYRMNTDVKDQYLADSSIFNAYNRTRIPIADQEWRKGFRYIFFTRPECYLMYRDGSTIGLCDQAFYDEDFSSSYTRMPHIIKLLSPWYVTGSYPTDATQFKTMLEETNKHDGSNWNFLFSNRVNGLSVAPTTMTIQENIGKSIEGYTITPAQFVDSRQGSTLDLTFTDTKNLEVFEMARLWMLYMYKRQKGIFLPPYNGYARENSFKVNKGLGMEKLSGPLSGIQFTRLHPYDRAIEYGASLYDIITNETGTKILYWCKYYGIYPISAAPSLDNSNNEAITQVSTSISFKYHYRLENNNKTLVEFNHDAGLTNALGQIAVDTVESSLPFLLRDEPRDKYNGEKIMPKYLGAAGMFTGSPYIVMEDSRPDPLDKSKILTTPLLKFMSIPQYELEAKYNIGISNTERSNLSRNVAAYTNPGRDLSNAVDKVSEEIIQDFQNLSNSIYGNNTI